MKKTEELQQEMTKRMSCKGSQVWECRQAWGPSGSAAVGNLVLAAYSQVLCFSPTKDKELFTHARWMFVVN